MKKVKLVTGLTYVYEGQFFHLGEEVEVSEAALKELLEIKIQDYDFDMRRLNETPYFAEVVEDKSDKKAKAAKVEADEVVAKVEEKTKEK
jgi:phosphoglycerol transferase MdoB-like AlkP superfamily enzyme